jgi:Polyketide cyclase / dehydrase and lipid transport
MLSRSVTRSIAIDRPSADVYAFLADLRNWPRWAVVNVLAVERADEPGWWRIETPDGPAEIRLRPDAATGVVDHDFRGGPDDTEVATVPARVVANGRGAEFLITILQPDEVDDTDFDRLLESVDTELGALKAVLERRQ